MKENYNIEIKMHCTVCGVEDQFEFNESKTYVKCNSCGREYLGGYEELKECNQENISQKIDDMKQEVKNDLKDDLHEVLKNTLKGNKNIKFK